MVEIITSIILGYLIGSIPTAFIILKISKGLDIRKVGSGNVGTLNSYEVTNSKLIGFVVLIIDLLKGIFSVVIVKYIFGDQFLLPMISLISAVFAHCYSIWLKFKGGRGLATAAGGSLIISPLILVIWLISWYLINKWKKDIHLANISATIIIVFAAILFSNQLNKLSFPSAETNFIFGFSISLVMIIILSKHIEPLKILLKKNR